MKEFEALRRKARERRDNAILRARNEFETTLLNIAKLEQDLLGRDVSNHKRISACISSVIPDRAFTTHDILVALKAADPTRNWRARSIDNYIARLRTKGILRRIRKSKGRERAIYVREGIKYDPLPFEDMKLVEVIAQVLGDRSMTQTELVVCMLEAGYDTQRKPNALREAVGQMMRADERFVVKGGKWSLA
jgi:predicted transcriptional regulator